jgi:carbonic anhydrase
MKSFFNHIKHDLPASLAVFFVAIPLCLGIAHASGAPLMAGLVTGAIGGILVGFISQSPLSVSGPAAGLTAIVLAAIEQLGAFDLFLLAVLIAGCIQIILGILKLGNVANYIPNNVIKGMLSAIGVLLIIKQFPHMIGYDVEEMGVEEFTIAHKDLNPAYHLPKENESNSLTVFLHSVRHIETGIFIIGLVSIVILFVWEKFVSAKLKSVPGSLIVVLIGVALNILFQSQEHLMLDTNHLVQVPSVYSWDVFLQNTTLPDWSAFTNPLVYKIALTLAIVASIETLLSIEAIDKLDPWARKSPPNRELIAQGFGNVTSGILGGIPLTAVIVRGSVNIAAGAKTKASTIFHGIFIITSVVFFARFINLIPLASLASILVFTGYKLVDISSFRYYYKKGLDQFIPFVITILAIVLIDLLYGVFVGLGCALIFIIRNNYQAPVLKVNDYGKRVRISLGENVTFLHKYKLLKEFEKIKDNTLLELDGSRSLFMDKDVMDAIQEFSEKAKKRNIQVFLGGIKMDENKPDLKNRMEESYKRLLKGNQNWIDTKTKNDPEFFARQAEGQAPEYLFIGCSDSRVPANEITGTEPGEMFVHRNIANLVVNTDINLMSVLQYSVEVLNVKHIIVCGHYGCGGVKAAMEMHPHGLIDKWLRNIKDVHRLHQHEIDAIPDENERLRRMVELSVREQIFNLMKTSFIQRNRQLYGFPDLHGWVYDISNGKIQDLKVQEDQEFREFERIYKLY